MPSAMHTHALSLTQERKRELVGFDAALELALSLSPWQHKRLVARYFWRQPGFLVDFVRYAVKSA